MDLFYDCGGVYKRHTVVRIVLTGGFKLVTVLVGKMIPPLKLILKNKEDEQISESQSGMTHGPRRTHAHSPQKALDWCRQHTP